MTEKFDYIIVGAGVAGCVLANRLSENPHKNILLIEAGKDTPPGAVPEDILDSYPVSYYNKSYTWPGLKASWKKYSDGVGHFPQGKVMGGGGAIMGMVSLRGTPDDYEEWKNGVPGWGWQDVLPYFKKMESDLDFHGDLHGMTGPIPIRRIDQKDWPPLTQSILEWSKKEKFPFVADMNGDFRDGIGAVPMCNSPTQRASSAIRYLTDEVRKRPNLKIIDQTLVERILFEKNQAVGVATKSTDGNINLWGHEIIVCTGGIFSPALLQRSGIGDPQLLSHLNIPIISALKGVGQNLQNHPILFVGFRLKSKARQSTHLRTHPSASIRYSSNLPETPRGDLYINIQSKTSWNAMGQQIGNLAACLLRPKSTGMVKINSQDSHASPMIEFNFLDKDQDVKRMMMVFKKSVEIVMDQGIAQLMGKPFPVRFSDKLRQLNEFNARNANKAKILASLLDTIPGIHQLVMPRLTGSNVNLWDVIAHEELLEAHVREHVAGMFHPVGTCKMGIKEDVNAVVDFQGRVFGVDNLRVVDASVMPNLVAGNTNIPTIMVAEKMAAQIAAIQ